MQDQLFNFSFKDAPIRGALVHTHVSFQDLTTQHGNQSPYPLFIKNLLGEMNAILVLMSSNLKVSGKMNLQIRGSGHLYSVFTEVQLNSTEDRANAEAAPVKIRGLARRHDQESQPTSLDLRDWVGDNATLAISLIPDVGQPYQGIVPLEYPKLFQCIEDYYQRSEQIPTFFWSQIQEDACAAIMVQHLPGNSTAAEKQSGKNHSSFEKKNENQTIDMETARALIHTLAPGELIQTSAETILHRLFHEFPVQHHISKGIQYECGCSDDRMLNALISLGEKEIQDMAQTMPLIKMDCQFCGESRSWETGFVLDKIKEKLNSDE